MKIKRHPFINLSVILKLYEIVSVSYNHFYGVLFDIIDHMYLYENSTFITDQAYTYCLIILRIESYLNLSSIFVTVLNSISIYFFISLRLTCNLKKYCEIIQSRKITLNNPTFT